jgi:multicomponent Na+:H+ antiporter subunit F
MIAIGAQIALYILILSFLLGLVRLVKGPALADRVVALDLLAFIAMGMVLLIMVITGRKEYMDIVIVGSLIVFIATVSISKYLTKGGQND